jgi:hypothetical protein
MGSIEVVTETLANLNCSDGDSADKPHSASCSHISKSLPVSNPTNSFWTKDIHELHNHRSTELLPEICDVVIIGAGYAGISTAYHLVEEQGTVIKSITILEARGVCSGATGRNGGHLRPDLYGGIPTYISRGGLEAGAEIARFEIATLHAMKKVIREENIDCDFTLTRTFDVWCNEKAAKEAKVVYDQMLARDVEYMDDTIFYTGKNVEGVRSNIVFFYTFSMTYSHRFVELKEL